MIKAVAFSHNLRAASYFARAIAAARDYGDRTPLGCNGADADFDDPGRTSLQMATERVDVIGLMLHRRMFPAMRIVDVLSL